MSLSIFLIYDYHYYSFSISELNHIKKGLQTFMNRFIKISINKKNIYILKDIAKFYYYRTVDISAQIKNL